MKGFRPLSLRNIVYKLISKLIVNRLKEAWRVLISPFQVSFVPGRQSIDNVVLCQEFVHSMSHTKARRGTIIIKLDLDKVYDWLEWSFIEGTLRDAALPEELVSMVMRMVSTGSCRLVWNGEKTDAIKSSRGLRQGDPMSPYLFVLYMEKLGHKLRKRVVEGRLQEVKASRGGIWLSHLFFAGDLLIFSEACEEQLSCIKEGLEAFCKFSCKRINFLKSIMFFLRMYPMQRQRDSAACWGSLVQRMWENTLGTILLWMERTGRGIRSCYRKSMR